MSPVRRLASLPPNELMKHSILETLYAGVLLTAGSLPFAFADHVTQFTGAVSLELEDPHNWSNGLPTGEVEGYVSGFSGLLTPEELKGRNLSLFDSSLAPENTLFKIIDSNLTFSPTEAFQFSSSEAPLELRRSRIEWAGAGSLSIYELTMHEGSALVLSGGSQISVDESLILEQSEFGLVGGQLSAEDVRLIGNGSIFEQASGLVSISDTLSIGEEDGSAIWSLSAGILEVEDLRINLGGVLDFKTGAGILRADGPSTGGLRNFIGGGRITLHGRQITWPEIDRHFTFQDSGKFTEVRVRFHPYDTPFLLEGPGNNCWTLRTGRLGFLRGSGEVSCRPGLRLRRTIISLA